MLVMSSSGANALFFGPIKKSWISIERLPPTLETFTAAPVASSAGWASPAGEADPKLPPTPPRFLICKEPTVRDAIANPGSSVASSA